MSENSSALSSTPVSDDLNELLERLVGIPDGKEDEAAELQRAALHKFSSGPIPPLGFWAGGCCYVRTTTAGGNRGPAVRVVCVA
jgi:hypothetical protein